MNMSNGTTTTYFVGSHYEVANGVVTKYYFAGSQRIALRTNGTLNYLLGDHLGSTSLTTDANGQVISELRYKPWGETRYASGTTPTKYTFTGQYSYAGEFGLHFYNARWYDSSLSRFASADTIVPAGVQGYDRIENEHIKENEMESFTVQATYEKGVLKPRKKLNLPERAVVEVQVRSIDKLKREATAFASLIGVWENLPAQKYDSLEKKLAQTRKRSASKIKRLAKKIR